MLEALGVRIDLSPDEVSDSISEVGFGFMFAPAHHAAMKHVVPTRKELAVRTIFNFLGPLTNPAGATRQLLGVSDRRYQETIAEALAGLGCEHALVVAGEDGLDELTIHGRSRVIEVSGSQDRGVVRRSRRLRTRRSAVWRRSRAAIRPPTPKRPAQSSRGSRGPPLSTSRC